jgi:adhesin transport system outer membrane protein
MKRKQGFVAALALSLSALSGGVQAQVASFDEAIKKAVVYSPQVNAAWYNFMATSEARRAAQGGYFPSVDLYADIGREERETPLFDFGDYSRDAVRFSVTQMLFDGFDTRNAVQALGFDRLSQYYQLQSASQEAALEAAQAYLDTVRFQQLVEYAKENYIVHRQVYDKIAERAGGGVSQGVDLEQAAARIALAESNLLTELTNLHDVAARFQRIVGDVPADSLPVPTVPTGMIPDMRDAALNLAYDQSPEIDAAIENLRAAQSELNRTNAPLMPRLDLRYRNEVEHDTDGLDGRFDIEAIELVLNYNLFRGGADSARKREFYNLYNAAIEERKQACINVRQNTMIAFNDIKALEDQVIFLNNQLLSQDKTRRAYTDQFDLGQRTLLDLLDAQNEYFDAQRAAMTARTNLMGAQARTLANMGLLTSAMSVDGFNQEKVEEMNLEFARGDDPNGDAKCPPEAPAQLYIDKETLFAELYGDANGGDATGAAVATGAVGALAAGSTRYRAAGENIVGVDLNVLFELNSSVISGAFDDEIARIAETMRENPGVQAVVEGHTDNTGTADYNMWLSERRANSVKTMLVEKHGVPESQLKAVGYGQTQPRADNATREGREQNRRVEMYIRDGSE